MIIVWLAAPGNDNGYIVMHSILVIVVYSVLGINNVMTI